MDAKELLLDMQESHRTILLDILDRLVPAGLEIWAFGSRARWTARETSDLDLVLRNPAQLETRLEAGLLDDLKEAFEESDLPFMVDLLDWATVSDKFRKVIDREYVVVRKGGCVGVRVGWKSTTWGAIATLEYGRSLKDYQNSSGHVPVFGTNGPIGFTDQPLCKFPSVIIGRKGAYRGVHYSKKPFFVIDTAFYLKPKTDELDLLFAYYQLLTQDINTMDSGSAIPSTSREDFYNLEVNLPPLETQRRIVATLSALDEKIELNRQANQTLEAIAQTLFKEWFVDFNFPGATGEMQESELGPIPNGWKVDGIGSLSYVQNGYAFKSGDFKEEGSIGIIKIKNIGSNIVDIINTQYVDESVVKTLSEKFLVKPESLLIAMTGAEVGKIGLVPFSDNCFWLNQRVGMFVERINYSNYYLYILLSSEIYQSTIRNSALGSAQPNISSSVIENIKAIIPDNETLISFGITAKPLIDKILYNISEIHRLSNIRDSLLPKLMNGEIEV